MVSVMYIILVKTVCADNTTCCKNAAGGWSCCPLPEAVCCVDLVHCCPKGKRCNLVTRRLRPLLCKYESTACSSG
uniref:Granulin a n=1 Tax=Cyclopterus lumpus TaxID=8103 RepID=A0A8C2WGF4_CYCLU